MLRRHVWLWWRFLALNIGPEIDRGLRRQSTTSWAASSGCTLVPCSSRKGFGSSGSWAAAAVLRGQATDSDKARGRFTWEQLPPTSLMFCCRCRLVPHSRAPLGHPSLVPHRPNTSRGTSCSAWVSCGWVCGSCDMVTREGHVAGHARVPILVHGVHAAERPPGACAAIARTLVVASCFEFATSRARVLDLSSTSSVIIKGHWSASCMVTLTRTLSGCTALTPAMVQPFCPLTRTTCFGGQSSPSSILSMAGS